MRSVSLLLMLVVACGGGKARPAAEPAPPPAEAPVENRVAEQELPPPEEVPPPDTLSTSTGVPECDEYLRVFEDLMVRCEKQLGPAVDSMRQSIEAQRAAFASWKQGDAAARAGEMEAAKNGCRAAADAVTQTMTSLNCP